MLIWWINADLDSFYEFTPKGLLPCPKISKDWFSLWVALDVAKIPIWAVVVAQLAEWSLLTPDVRSLKLIIGKILFTNSTFQNTKKTKIKKKRPGIAHLLNEKSPIDWTPHRILGFWGFAEPTNPIGSRSSELYRPIWFYGVNQWHVVKHTKQKRPKPKRKRISQVGDSTKPLSENSLNRVL